MQFDLEHLIDAIADRIVEKLAATNNGTSSAGARLLTVEAAAEYIGRTKAAMDHLIAAGTVPTVRIDRRVMIDVRDLDKLIEENKTA